MYFSGVELTRQRSVKYCSEYHCNKSIPLCCICVSSDCSENSNKWNHISAGEHICSACFNRILSFFCYDKSCMEIIEWKRNWLRQSQENATVIDYIVDRLVPQWCLCNQCGKWRQVTRDNRLGPGEIEDFNCQQLISHIESPCNAPEDSRIEFIKKQPQAFFESIKYQPLLITTPCLHMYNNYSLDIVGVSPTATSIDYSFDKSSEFMDKFKPFLACSKLELSAGSFNPTCLEIWEHEMFSVFSGNLRNIFIGLRNLMLMLWAVDQKRVVNEALLNKFVLIHGIVRVALLVNTVPDLIRVYTGYGYINHGFLPSPVHLFEEHLQKKIVIIGGNLSGIAAANHLANLGANVTILDPYSRGCSLEMLDIVREVHGPVNNPLVMAAYQLGVGLREVSDAFTIFDCEGNEVDDDVDKYFQNFVYGFVDYLKDELNIIKNSTVTNNSSLQDLYNIYKTKMIDETYVNYVFVQEVYLAELEYRLFGGASLSSVSTNFQFNSVKRNFSNFDLKQFCGGIVEPVDNWRVLRDFALDSLENIESYFGSKVESVNKRGDKYIITTAAAAEYEADKVVLALDPWDMGKIEMKDVLEGVEGVCDEEEMEGGTLFVVKMVFSRAFWREATRGAEMFAVTGDGDTRGFCHLFRESSQADGAVELQTKVFGASSWACESLSDELIVKRAVKKLTSAFFTDSSLHCVAQEMPLHYQVHRFPGALLSATDFGLKCSRLAVSPLHSTGIYINKFVCPDVPMSLSHNYVTGLETATSLIKDVL